MSPETWKTGLYHKAEISKEFHKEDSKEHTPHLQQKCVTGLRWSMENFNPKGVSLRKTWAQVVEDRQEQQLELYLRSSSSCQPLINNSPPVQAPRSRGEIDAVTCAVWQPAADTRCGCMSRDPHHHPYSQGHHPLDWDVLRAISCFSELPCMDPSGCWWLGSLASRGVVGYHQLMNTSSTDSGPSACFPWALPWLPGDQLEGSLSSSTSLPARTGSGQPGPLLQKMMLLWGGRVSWSLSTAHLTSPCPPWEPGIAETWEESEATATWVLSQPETPTQLLPTRLCPPSEQGGCLQKAALETVFRQSNTNRIWKPISSQFLPALKHLFFLFTMLGLSKMEGGFLFLWKTERKTK